MKRHELIGVIAEMEALHEAGVGLIVKTDTGRAEIQAEAERIMLEAGYPAERVLILDSSEDLVPARELAESGHCAIIVNGFNREVGIMIGGHVDGVQMKPNAWIVVIAEEDDVIDSATASRVAVFEADGGILDLEELEAMGRTERDCLIRHMLSQAMPGQFHPSDQKILVELIKRDGLPGWSMRGAIRQVAGK
jgi:hypothetical protein